MTSDEAVKAIMRADLPPQSKVVCSCAVLFGTLDKDILAKFAHALPDEIEDHFQNYHNRFGTPFLQIFSATKRSIAGTAKRDTGTNKAFGSYLSAVYRQMYFHRYGTKCAITDAELRSLKKLMLSNTEDRVKREMKQFLDITKDSKKATLSHFMQYRMKQRKQEVAAKKRATKRIIRKVKSP